MLIGGNSPRRAGGCMAGHVARTTAHEPKASAASGEVLSDGRVANACVGADELRLLPRAEPPRILLERLGVLLPEALAAERPLEADVALVLARDRRGEDAPGRLRGARLPLAPARAPEPHRADREDRLPGPARDEPG